MAIKYLSGLRLTGTEAERTAMTTLVTTGDGTLTGTSYSSSSKLGTHSLFLDNGAEETDHTHYSSHGDTDLSITEDMSISCWIYSDSDGNYSGYKGQTIINQGYNFGGNEYGWWFGHGLMYTAPAGGSNALVFSAYDERDNTNARCIVETADSVFSQSTWTHIGVTKDGSEVRIYVNGSLVQTRGSSSTGSNGDPTSLADYTHIRDTAGDPVADIDYHSGTVSGSWTPARKIWIGTRDPNHDDFAFKGDYDGKIDDLGVWNTTLSASNMASLYNSGTGALCNTVASASLKLYINFDENVGNEVNVDTYPKLQDGTIYEEQDTGKIYIWKLSTNTWSEIT